MIFKELPDLVPIANNWVYGLDPMTRSDILNRPSKFATYEEHIVNAWIQEVVLKDWWYKLSDRQMASFRAHVNFDSPETPTDWIVKFYLGEHPFLKEQEVKEDSSLFSMRLNATHPLKSISESVLVPSEKVLSTETVEPIIFFRELNKSVVNCESHFFGISCLECTHDEALESFGRSLKVKIEIERKESKELIQSLLDALKWIADPILTANDGGDAWCAVRDRPGASQWANHDLPLAIKKAKEYLGTKSNN